MEIGTIISKLLNGESLTEEEKDFAAKFNLSETLDKTAANARRKAEADAARHLAEIARLNAELAETKKTAEAKTAEGTSEIGKLTKTVEKLQASLAAMEKKATEAEAENARVKRNAAIDEFAKGHGVRAAKGVNESLFRKFLLETVGDTDVADEDAMKAVLETFKKENAAIVLNEGVVMPRSGDPSNGVCLGKNPFARGSENATEQFELFKSNPALARQLATEAGVTLE